MPQYAPPDPIRPRPVMARKHRGGAWKVAYADFVTAMMALFIVLWMMNSSKPVREAIAGHSKTLPVLPANSAPPWKAKARPLSPLKKTWASSSRNWKRRSARCLTLTS